MNPSSSSLSKNSSEILSPEIVEDFQYLLSEIKKEVIFTDKSLKSDYSILDLAIKRRYPNSETYHFRQYIIRQNKQI